MRLNFNLLIALPGLFVLNTPSFPGTLFTIPTISIHPYLNSTLLITEKREDCLRVLISHPWYRHLRIQFAMVDLIIRPNEGNTIFLFGPQALSFDEDDFRNLRSTIMKTENHHWILDTIAGLPNCMDSIGKACPKLMTGSRSRLSLLEDLQNWFSTGRTSQEPGNLPNILLGPLVIITQLVQYTEYQMISRPSLEKGEDFYDLSNKNAETMGFCIGLLSALAVSSSRNRESFEESGAVAIRIGMLIGMVVDAQNAAEESGPPKSLATIWHSAEEKQKMSEILDSFPEVIADPSNTDSLTLADSACRHTSLSFMMKTERP